MDEYLPFADKHSIQEAQATLVFPANFDQLSIESARGITQSELSHLLPRSSEVRGGAIQIDLSNPETPTQIGNISSNIIGFQLARVQGNAQPAQTVTLSGTILSVSFFQYESWDTTRQAAAKYLSTVLPALPLVNNPVVAFGLKIIDRYTFDGTPENARADLLVQTDSPYVAPNVFDAGSAWHCNTGWFEQGSDEPILHNLNIASNLVDLSPTVTIEHQATVHLRAPRQSTDTLFTPPPGYTGLMEALDQLHDRNKVILQQILVPAMLDRIGITP